MDAPDAVYLFDGWSSVLALPLADRDPIENPMECEPQALIPELRSTVESTELGSRHPRWRNHHAPVRAAHHNAVGHQPIGGPDGFTESPDRRGLHGQRIQRLPRPTWPRAKGDELFGVGHIETLLAG